MPLPNVNTEGWKTVPEVAAELNLKPHYIRTLGKKWEQEYFALMGEFGPDSTAWPRQPGGVESRRVTTGEGLGQQIVFNPKSIATYTARSRTRTRNNDGREAFKIRLNAEELVQLETNMPAVYATLKSVKKYTPKPKKAKA
jgi:hypothetical protein